MNYSVTAEKEMTTIEKTTVSGSKVAEKAALEMCKKYPGHRVFVSWFRASDGQTGYLNPGGNHGITGHDWNA